MSRDNKDTEYPSELESQFILRLPEEPAKSLREVLKLGESLKNRLTIQIENDRRHGEVQFDHWLLHGKIVDLPTIIESLKTIDNKNFYKTSDISQMMVCKDKPDTPSIEEESPAKSKKKDVDKVDKKFLWPHGITPPTKNVRKKRFRKTLKKKHMEAPEVEKDVKRLLRADNEALSFTWEVIKEEDDRKPEPSTSSHVKPKRKPKAVRSSKRETKTSEVAKTQSSKVVDIFGGAVSDSDEENINVEMEDSHMSLHDIHLSNTNTLHGLVDTHSKRDNPTQSDPQMLQGQSSKGSTSRSHKTTPATCTVTKSGCISSEEDGDYQSRDVSKDNMQFRLEELRTELEELKQRRQRTKHEIEGMENLTLRQRFQDILHTLNQDIMYKDMEYQGIITLQNSDYI